MFYDNFVKLCADNGKKPADVSRELGISKSTMSCWKLRNAKPTDSNLQKLAKYFGVSASDLTADEQKEKPTRSGELDEKAIDMLLDRMTIAELQELMGKTAAAMAKRAQNG